MHAAERTVRQICRAAKQEAGSGRRETFVAAELRVWRRGPDRLVRQRTEIPEGFSRVPYVVLPSPFTRSISAENSAKFCYSTPHPGRCSHSFWIPVVDRTHDTRLRPILA